MEVEFSLVANTFFFCMETFFFETYTKPQHPHVQISYAFLHSQRIAGDKADMHYSLVEKASSYPPNRTGTQIKGRQEPESISNELKSLFVFHLAIKSYLMFKNTNITYLKKKRLYVLHQPAA